LLEDKQIAKLGGSWYVQNVSTFPNTFAVISPLICVFWIQLTQNNAIFSRIALVSCFLQKSNFQEKSWKILQKSYFTRRPTEPEYETKRAWEATTPPGGVAQAWLRQGVVRPAQPSPRALLPPTNTLWPETIGGWAFFPYRVPLHHHHQKPRFGTRNSVLAPCRDGDLEEIFIIIITDVSPSTIHDSPIHVWVIPTVGEGDWMRLFM
jgi:hypothetical protein